MLKVNQIVMFLFCAFFTNVLIANNLKIADKVITDVNGSYLNIKCDISWENSWRNNENWDAAWIFMKVRKDNTSPWQHAYLSVTQSDHNASDLSGNGLTPVTEVGTTSSKGVGVFVYRSALGTGSNDWELNLRVNYSDLNNISNADLNTLGLDVFGVEMVYVPEGGYYLGDKMSENGWNRDFPPILEQQDLIVSPTTSGYPNYYSTTNPDESNEAVYVVDKSSNRSLGTSFWVYGNEDHDWVVDFGVDKVVAQFAVGVYNDSSCLLDLLGDIWFFEGSANGTDWSVIWSGVGNYSIGNSYPIPVAVPVVNPRPFRYYRVRQSVRSSVRSHLVLTHVSMSEEPVLPFLQVESEGEIVGIYDSKWTAKTVKIPSTFPKGYNAFYCMKYETSQEQYVDFLNTLTYAQQNLLTVSSPSSAKGTPSLGSGNRNGIKTFIPAKDALSSAIYGMDLNGNGIFFEDGDGESVACNYVNFKGAFAYADWAGLQPISDFEYEKAARGPIQTIGGEYAWGSNVDVERITGFSSGTEGKFSEEAISGSMNVNSNNAGVGGPVRTGCFAFNASDRIFAGAGYWGCMELSGNLWEYVIPARCISFCANHGDGILGSTTYGYDVAGWPISTSYIGLRGGSWKSILENCRISDRARAVDTDVANRREDFGFRAVRTGIFTELCLTIFLVFSIKSP